MKYQVIYSIADTYETYVEVDDPTDIEDYLWDNALEEGFGRMWVGAGIIVERYYPAEETNA
jgi:hypothetical protein